MGAPGVDVLAFGHTHRPFHKVLHYEADGEHLTDTQTTWARGAS